MYQISVYKVTNFVVNTTKYDSSRYVKVMDKDYDGEELDMEFFVAFEYNSLTHAIGSSYNEAFDNLMEKLEPSPEPEPEP